MFFILFKGSGLADNALLSTTISIILKITRYLPKNDGIYRCLATDLKGEDQKDSFTRSPVRHFPINKLFVLTVDFNL